MKVSLKHRVSEKTGKTSLYLEVYKGYDKLPNGKIKHYRDYDYLDYFLYNKPKNPTEKQHNKENLKAAEAVKAQRILEIQNGVYGFNNVHKLNTNFIEYFKKLTDERFKSKGNYGNWDSALKHLSKFANPNITFKDITQDFCEGFKNYLLNDVRQKSGQQLSTNAASSYFNKFRAALNQAFDDRIINDNPAKRVKCIKQEETHREYLTLEELLQLIKTDCRSELLKRAFLFSCFTGLRFSDIKRLTWGMIHKFDGGNRIEFRQQKTKGIEYLDIPNEALKYMGEKKSTQDFVFHGLEYSDYINIQLLEWCIRAGISKHITFHCARHTYATFMLTKGVDLLTVSKMLGHKKLVTTQIYTKVIDQKKRDAVNVFDEAFK